MNRVVVRLIILAFALGANAYASYVPIDGGLGTSSGAVCEIPGGPGTPRPDLAVNCCWDDSVLWENCENSCFWQNSSCDHWTCTKYDEAGCLGWFEVWCH